MFSRVLAENMRYFDRNKKKLEKFRKKIKSIITKCSLKATCPFALFEFHEIVYQSRLTLCSLYSFDCFQHRIPQRFRKKILIIYLQLYLYPFDCRSNYVVINIYFISFFMVFSLYSLSVSFRPSLSSSAYKS